MSEKEKYNGVFKNSCLKSNNTVFMQNLSKRNFYFVQIKTIASGLKQSSASTNHFVTIHNPYKKNKKMIKKNYSFCNIYGKHIILTMKEF